LHTEQFYAIIPTLTNFGYVNCNVHSSLASHYNHCILLITMGRTLMNYPNYWEGNCSLKHGTMNFSSSSS